MGNAIFIRLATILHYIDLRCYTTRLDKNCIFICYEFHFQCVATVIWIMISSLRWMASNTSPSDWNIFPCWWCCIYSKVHFIAHVFMHFSRNNNNNKEKSHSCALFAYFYKANISTSSTTLSTVSTRILVSYVF